ncbi:hypothetical protein A0J48_001190 [Sphaerospermopsis aphanizomenoides BCCUSP55]|uniref:hypothetical protein n=1 Tax=Sphaerospermopsis aphanizomenoides TaxID=459663 RepID=UPI000A7B8E8B|nr:hypothetical protein [Sphaerospermopsis aphanizomenoides]MBK1986178.1 hypothetical protein [Sphaerospermopsis aphanizomenoides BCCUSP55]
MSYVSLLKNIPEKLSQPTGIAAIASLGIHGAIALIVPLMPVNSSKSSETNTTKAVGLMELTPADQNRLPQTPGTSEVALQPPQLPLQQQLPPASFDSQSITLPPLQPPLPSQQVLPSIPTSPANYNLAFLPRRQTLQRFSSGGFRTQVSNFQPTATLRRSESPFVNDIDAKIKETQPLNINRLPEVQADNKLPDAPLSNPSPDAIDIGSTTTAQEMTPRPTGQLGDNSAQIAANSPSGLVGEQSLQDKRQLVAAAPNSVPSPEAVIIQQPEQRTSSRSDSQTQKREELQAHLNSYNTIRQAIEQEYPNAKEKPVIRESISTDKRDMEGTVLGRLVVDPDGKVLDIKFQDKSLAPKLQSQTREFFNANPPKGEQRISSYPFQLLFKNSSDNNLRKKTPELKPSQTQDAQTVIEQQEIKNQANNQAVIIPNPSSTPVVTDNPSNVSTESAKKLIKQLRQIKEERETLNQEK